MNEVKTIESEKTATAFEVTYSDKEENSDGTIPIFFTIDDDYAMCLGPALQSIVDNANPDRSYTVVIMHEDLSARNEMRLEAIVRSNPAFSVEFVPMKGKILGIQNRMSNWLRSDYFTLTIFFRLFIPEMFPQWDKGIYIDSDIVVPGDISELFDVQLGDNLIGACHDRSIVDIKAFVDYVDTAVGVGIENYVNSGVLLYNMKKLREAGFQERFTELLAKYSFDSVAPDQDYFNSLCFGKIRFLDDAWDAMPVEGKPEMENPKLVHYNLFSKPWHYDGVPYEDRFWYYAEKSGFADEARECKAAYTDEQRQKDTEALGMMVERGAKIALQTENTMASVFNTGKERRL